MERQKKRKEKQRRNCSIESPTFPKRSSEAIKAPRRGESRRGNPKKHEPRERERGACLDCEHFLRVKLHERNTRSKGTLDYFNREITQSRVQPGGFSVETRKRNREREREREKGEERSERGMICGS